MNGFCCLGCMTWVHDFFPVNCFHCVGFYDEWLWRSQLHNYCFHMLGRVTALWWRRSCFVHDLAVAVSCTAGCSIMHQWLPCNCFIMNDFHPAKFMTRHFLSLATILHTVNPVLAIKLCCFRSLVVSWLSSCRANECLPSTTINGFDSGWCTMKYFCFAYGYGFHILNCCLWLW